MGRPKALNEMLEAKIVFFRRQGMTYDQIAEAMGRPHLRTSIGRFLRGEVAQARLRGMPASTQQSGAAAMERWGDDNPPPKGWYDLSDRAKRGLRDFPFFCSDILGEPLQVHQLGWDGIEETEIAQGNRFIQINVHPRGGKTDWRTNKKALWRLIGGGRSKEFYEQPDPPLRDLRLVLVAGSESQSDKNCEYIQSRLAEHGRLIGEYGRFKQAGLAWRPSQGVLTIAGRRRLELAGDYSLVCVGMRSHFLGRGGDEIVADDAFDLENCATAEAAEKCLHWLRTQVFSRLEPGGSISVLGARLPMVNDPYIQIAAWPAAVEERGFEDDTALEAPEGEDYPRLFHTICQPAVLDWDKRIVLCPERFSWGQMMQAKALAGPEVWESTWMQRAAGGRSTIARREWIYGGTTGSGVLEETHYGCLDHDRTWGEYELATVGLPKANEAPWAKIRVLTIDPSDRKYWAFIVEDVYKIGRDYHPVLLDLDRNRHNTSSALTLMRSWQATYDYRVLVLERNIAKFLIENEAFQDFLKETRLRVIYHDTTAASKLHKEWGMGTLADDFRLGHIRIPNGDTETRWKFQYLIKEALGELVTTDCLMATWFPKYNLAGLLAMADSGSNWPGWAKSPGRHKPPPARLGKYWAGTA
jgi:hypothetical protein